MKFHKKFQLNFLPTTKIDELYFSKIEKKNKKITLLFIFFLIENEIS